MMNKKGILTAAIVLLLTLSACAGRAPVTDPPTATEMPTTTPHPLPEVPAADEIEAWIERSRELFLGQARSFEGQLYILVTYGIKPTGGYGIEIESADVVEGRLQVNVSFHRPADDEMVTEALTTPYDLLIIADPAVPVDFIAAGDEFYLPTLFNLPFLPELLPVGGTRLYNPIRAFAPLPSLQPGGTFVIEGVANVFEGNVLYRLMDGERRVLAEGYTTAAMGDWGHFVIELPVPAGVNAGDQLEFELYTQSAKDGSEQDLIGFGLNVTE